MSSKAPATITAIRLAVEPQTALTNSPTAASSRTTPSTRIRTPGADHASRSVTGEEVGPRPEPPGPAGLTGTFEVTGTTSA